MVTAPALGAGNRGFESRLLDRAALGVGTSARDAWFRPPLGELGHGDSGSRRPAIRTAVLWYSPDSKETVRRRRGDLPAGRSSACPQGMPARWRRSPGPIGREARGQ